jgi:hypothetical protein
VEIKTMLRIAISVEGISEREFCESILVPFFLNENISITPIVINTSKKGKGGSINIDRVENNVIKLLKDFDYVTTMYDLYGFEIDDKITAIELESKIKTKINSNRFIPYIQQYEFETLLFSNPTYFGECLDIDALNSINNIIKEFNGNIEDINNSKQTSPSKRIEKIFEDSKEKYNKKIDSIDILKNIGLDTIRQKASRFDKWIKKILELI